MTCFAFWHQKTPNVALGGLWLPPVSNRFMSVTRACPLIYIDRVDPLASVLCHDLTDLLVLKNLLTTLKRRAFTGQPYCKLATPGSLPHAPWLGFWGWYMLCLYQAVVPMIYRRIHITHDSNLKNDTGKIVIFQCMRSMH